MSDTLESMAAAKLRAAVDDVVGSQPDLSATARAAFIRLIEVLEHSPDAVIFASDQSISTQQAAALLGVSRMRIFTKMGNYFSLSTRAAYP